MDVQEAITSGLSPFMVPLPVKLNDYSNEHYYLTEESSSIEGRWQSLPYQVAILNWMGNDDIRTLTWRKATRVGYTKCLTAAFVYFAEHKRRNILIYQPTDGDAQKFTEDEINPLLYKIPVLRAICKRDPEKRSSDFKTDRKKFIGSTLDILGGKTARNYRRYTKDVVIYDELSGFVSNVDGEGSPVSLGDVRVSTSSFPKSIRGSNPKIKNDCLISKELMKADYIMHRFVPCPHCRQMQILTWRDDNGRYYFDFETKKYICIHCGAFIDYSQYPEMDKKGQWMTADQSIYYDEELDGFFTADGEKIPDPKHIGIDKLWSAYSYFTTWEDIILEFQDAMKEQRETGDYTQLITFINTKLGEEWEDRGERVEQDLYDENRLDTPSDKIDNGIVFITMWSDVQGGKNARLEYEVVGWGVGKESWSLEYGEISGEPNDPFVWDHLEEIRKKVWTRADGVNLGVTMSGVDAGYMTDEVYEYTTPRQPRVVATMGDAQPKKPITRGYTHPKKGKKTRLYMVGTDTAKMVLFNRLNKITEPGPGYCHFPADREESYFDMLTKSEEKITVKDRKTGKSFFRFRKISGRRNEALDCRVGNMAVLDIANPNLEAERVKCLRYAEAIKHNITPKPVNSRRRVRSKGIA